MNKIANPAGGCFLLLCSLAITAPSLMSQTDARPHPTVAPETPGPNLTGLAFDVVDIKRDKSGIGPPSIQSAANGDSVIIANMSPRMLIGLAYNVDLHDMIYGLPGWADSDGYDITAKVADADLNAFRRLLPRQRNPMLQPLLANRFHLKVHYEARVIPAYALVLARGGSKLIPVEPALTPDGRRDPGGIERGRNRIIGVGADISVLSDVLSEQLGRPVVDRTGLPGHYNFTLQFAPAQVAVESQSDVGPSIFTAVVEQLGLKLQPTKTSMPVLAVDHIEKPSQN